MKPATSSTVARMAGNILSGLVASYMDQDRELADEDEDAMVELAVRIARKTLAEIARTEVDDERLMQRGGA